MAIITAGPTCSGEIRKDTGQTLRAVVGFVGLIVVRLAADLAVRPGLADPVGLVGCLNPELRNYHQSEIAKRHDFHSSRLLRSDGSRQFEYWQGVHLGQMRSDAFVALDFASSVKCPFHCGSSVATSGRYGSPRLR